MKDVPDKNRQANTYHGTERTLADKFSSQQLGLSNVYCKFLYALLCNLSPCTVNARC